jgi:hypothetical protein
MSNPILDFSNLILGERIQLAEDLGDSLAGAPGNGRRYTSDVEATP